MRPDSFEKFYFEKVALGEGCGCAEHVTRIRDLDAMGNRLASGRVRPGILSAALGWFQSAARRMMARRRTQQ
jgi:hypothetical protein